MKTLQPRFWGLGDDNDVDRYLYRFKIPQVQSLADSIGELALNVSASLSVAVLDSCGALQPAVQS